MGLMLVVSCTFVFMFRVHIHYYMIVASAEAYLILCELCTLAITRAITRSDHVMVFLFCAIFLQEKQAACVATHSSL